MCSCVCPYLSGDVDKTVEYILPIVEILYEMPERRPEDGSDQWLGYMKKNIHQATLENLASYPELLRIYIKDQKKRGTKKVIACVLML